MAVTEPPVPVTMASNQVEEDDESFQVVCYRRNKYNRRFQAQQSQQYNGGGAHEFSNGRGKYYGNRTNGGGSSNPHHHQQPQQQQHHQVQQQQQQNSHPLPANSNSKVATAGNCRGPGDSASGGEVQPKHDKSTEFRSPPLNAWNGGGSSNPHHQQQPQQQQYHQLQQQQQNSHPLPANSNSKVATAGNCRGPGDSTSGGEVQPQHDKSTEFRSPSLNAWNGNQIKRLESNGEKSQGTWKDTLAAKSSWDDWPALESAVDDTAESLTSLSLECKMGQFDSSSTASVDSLDDDIDSPGKLCVEKWPLISNGDSLRNCSSAKKDILSSLEPTQSSRQKHSSSDDTAGGNTSVSSDDTVAEVIRNSSTDEIPARRKKGAKLKWVPLKLTELAPKHRTKREKSSKFKNSRHERGDSPSGTAGRGRGRGGGGRGRGVGRGARSSHQYFFSESSDPNTIPPPNHRDDYTDYPPDFTTLAPVFSEVSEFIMPYVADNFFASSFVQPSVGNATDSPTTAFPVGMEDALLVELLKQQIEYYFSEENLAKDFYLRRKMDSDGYLPIKLIASFQRVQNMTHDYNNVVSAILSSEILEVKEDMSCVRTVLTPTKWPIADTLYLAVSPSEFLNPPVPSHV